MASEETHNRKRDSITELEREIYDIFQAHPKASKNDADEPVIPGDALVDILRMYSTRNAGTGDLLSKDEEEQLVQVIEATDGVEVTPQLLLQFIAQFTGLSHRPIPGSPPPSEAQKMPLARGRPDEKTEFVYYTRSRSSSQDAIGASVYTGTPSRPPSRGPSASSKSSASAFDISARQRSTPLVTAPSSWSRRPPPARRRSDAGLHQFTPSDSESSASISSPPVAWSRSRGATSRSRTPSVPSTPEPHSTRSSGALSPISIGSPSSFGASISRPHSRTQSQPQSHFSNFGLANDDSFRSSHEGDDDSDWEYEQQVAAYDRATGMMSPPPSDLSEVSFDRNLRGNRRSTMTVIRRTSASDTEDDSPDEDHTVAPGHQRSATSSTVSLDMQERLEALQRVNDDLKKKLKEAEDSIQRRLDEHESEIDMLQQELEETKQELSAARKLEKELRGQERTNSTQIQTLENTITATAKQLASARAAQSSMSQQYQDQCAESGRLRDSILARDDELRRLRDQNALQAVELKKWEDEQTHWQMQVKQLEEELAAAQDAQRILDEQKQENLVLKETIDRMRFELEGMRQAAASGHAGSSGQISAKNSISRSLGAELASKLQETDWDAEDGPNESDEETETEVVEDDDVESEDVVQTIITRTKRKVPSRAKHIDMHTFEEVKEYSDAGIQHDVSTGTFAVQTDPEARPMVSSFSTQTDDLPTVSMEIQTEPEIVPPQPVILMAEMEIQTDDAESESVTSHSIEDADESMASSSSTLVPATPKAQQLHVHDLPPAYNDQDELAMRVADETLRKWHNGLKLPIEALPAGISEDAIEDWNALKKELGVGCAAIDRIVEGSARTGFPRQDRESRRRSRFYNIYNTYVYGGKGYALLSSSQIMLMVGGTAAIAYFFGQLTASPHLPLGGPVYYDRAAWSSFNSIQAVGEGFHGGNGPAAFWDILGRIGGGAARTLRGFPT